MSWGLESIIEVLATVVPVLPYPLQAFEGGGCTALKKRLLKQKCLV